MFRKFIELIPNALTCCNLLSGCMAIYFAFCGTGSIGCLTGYEWCCVMIGIAALFDFCDGAAARLLKAFSPLGADLDSLSDLVSFGVAPAMLVLNMFTGHCDVPWLGFIAFLIPVCGAIRLARFNNDSTQSTVFRGLPIPANAIFWIGMYGWFARYGVLSPAILAVLVVAVSLSMLGNFKMLSLKFKNFHIHDNFLRYCLLLGAAAFIVFYGLSGLLWTVVMYYFISFLGQKRL